MTEQRRRRRRRRVIPVYPLICCVQYLIGGPLNSLSACYLDSLYLYPPHCSHFG